MKKEFIHAVVKLPGQPANNAIIDNDLEALQRIVGGGIETVTLGKLVVICNEEGLIRGLAPNCNVMGADFVGAVILCGADGDELDDLPMPPKEAIALCKPYVGWL